MQATFSVGHVPRNLDGKVAIVVGAGSSGPGWGTGKATAVHLARLGAGVLGIDVNADATAATGDWVRQEGGKYEAFVGDATTPEGAAAAVNACIDRFGRVDILVNNIGAGPVEGVVETSLEDWERVFRFNVTSAFLMAKHAIQPMISVGGGSIVNVSSIASNRWTGVPLSAYSASKAAMNQLTQNIAMQYAAKGIRCNAVLPGLLMTPMMLGTLSRHYGNDVDALIRKRDAVSPTGKMGTGWDIAYAVGFLASDESRYINGVLLPVDGGLSCQVIGSTG
ncbi:MAG: Dihydroanticapsin 7-dehydrogenase [Burkholderiaceae bacterium]|jgi:NAD(P)-dependent dehydrogenase (short-subunit alcohol dehydrogenase family)|uniref:SDR family oxidoreductase n=1 Tax=Piscinibacter koreensis TaxID=2742824 RepID=A0A7Y6NNH9_9BURK|nr:SDR family oxidoreductase [Schlegelella koreensis]MCG3190456.1 Dihydroanticapsin 7-dehydrogenase [Burkholderiaceae bacterium]MDX9741942.1 SDR family oxidoreductase [Gammaproteobacteria bacterium]NBP83991.1 SDR family oxidoreductase [Mycobacteriaceae bacterium]NBQ41295.1 SDR family oxidoreductase [Mycobacteriaceae bacterium]NUZ06356.1 SDR family oxidoreductase [Schlegelella koreensis]